MHVGHLYLPSFNTNTSGFSGNFNLLRPAFHVPSNGLCAQATVNGTTSATKISFFMGLFLLLMIDVLRPSKIATTMDRRTQSAQNAPEYTPKSWRQSRKHPALFNNPLAEC